MSEPERFGRYRVTGKLGAGAMGEVYAAVDEVLGRQVAVKTLKSRATGAAARMLDERFRQEARAIAQLAHPGVVQVFDIDLAAEPPYLVMERVAGPSLKERIAERPLRAHELRALGIQIARALTAAHAVGIVHRDVKPANILVAGDGLWKLADFGVAHVPDSSLTMTGQFVGSPGYAAPEALVRGQTDPSGDVYGLGASLYEAACGRWPRVDASAGLLAPLPSINLAVPELPPDLADAIDRTVSVEPGERPRATELAEQLARGDTTATAARPPAGGMRWFALALGGTAALSGVLLVFALGSSGPQRAARPLGGAYGRPIDAAVPTPVIVDGGVADAPAPDAALDAGADAAPDALDDAAADPMPIEEPAAGPP